MKSKSLYLHIGQTKTGSKWIQKIFSLNAQTLLANGIHYPMPSGEIEATQTINTFETNAQLLFSPSAPIETILPEKLKDHSHSLLLSAEIMLYNLIQSLDKSPGKADQELKYMKDMGFKEIHFLLLIRSPVKRIISQLNQHFKVGKIDHLPEKKHFIHLANSLTLSSEIKIIEFLQKYPFCKLTLLNYEAIENDFVTPLANWLQISADSIQSPAVNRINRSLSYEELYILTQIKGSARECIPDITFNWICELPELHVKKMYPSVDIQEMIWHENESYLARINALLPEKLQLHKEILPEFRVPEKLVFEPKQLDILIHFLTQHAQEKQPADPPAGKTFLQKCKRYIKKRISIR